jgi:hypothetical protein
MGPFLIEEAGEKAGGISSPGEKLKDLIRELTITGLPLNHHSNGYVTALNVKSGPGYLLGFTCYSSNASAQFIQVHDTQTLPASGAVPCLVVTVAATSNLAVYFNTPGRSFLYGIAIVNSSTGPTYTAGAADTFIDAQFI